MNIFITGTDTDVGKTVVTAGLAAYFQNKGKKTAVFKPVQSGAETEQGKLVAPDLKFVEKINPNVSTLATYNLKHPVAPSLAAELENVKISTDKILKDYSTLASQHDVVLIEGAGGIMAPIYRDSLVIDLIKKINVPLLIVARPNLGTINHTLLTINAAKQYNIRVLGLIVSNYPQATDDIAIKTAPGIIEDLSGIKVLGCIPSIDFSNENLLNVIVECIDLEYLG